MNNNFLLFILILIILLLICIVRFDQKKNENEHFRGFGRGIGRGIGGGLSGGLGRSFSLYGLSSVLGKSKNNSNNESKTIFEPTEKPTEKPLPLYKAVSEYYSFNPDNLYDLVDCKRYDFLCKTRTEKWEYVPYYREQTLGIYDVDRTRRYR